MNPMISRQKLIEELTDVIIKHTCKPSGCQDCLCAFEYGIVEESCEEYLEYNKLAKKIYNEFVVKIIDQKPQTVGIDKQKLIEEYYDKIVGGYDMGCRPEDRKEAELLGESCMECVMRRTGELIASQPPADQWIPCSERLPEASGYYEVTVQEITADGTGHINRSFAGYLLSHNRWVTNGMHSYVVTAWREPLPEPYKGGWSRWT